MAGEEAEGGITKGHKETFGGERSVQSSSRRWFQGYTRHSLLNCTL